MFADSAEDREHVLKFFVVITLDFAVTFGRNDHGLSCLQKWRDDAIISIIAFVGQYRLRLNERQQNIRSIQITGLAWRESKAHRMAQGIHRGVDLGA